MFKILIPAIFLMGNAFAEFNISNIKLTPTELEIVGDSLEEIKSVAIISNDSRKDFEINNVTSNQVNASPLDNTTLNEWRVLNLVISDSEKESTYPITISQKNGLITFYKLQEKETPVVNSPNKMVLDQINFVPGENNTGYDYNYSLYANPTGDFAIKGADKDLFKIDNEGNVEISGTLKIKGKQIGFNIPYLPIKEQTIPSNSANKVVFSAGESKELVESGYTIPMNICPKGQILKSDGINFVCSLEASQEEQLGPVYTNQKSNLGIDQIYRELQINNLVIDSSGNITGALNFTSLGIMDVATGTFHVDSAAGRVGIGNAAPTYKLDIQGAANSGIRLKQAALVTTNSGGYFNGMVMEDPTGDSFGIGFSAGNTFWINSFDGGTYRNIFSINGVTGNGAILGNLKIGAYTLPAADGASGTVLKTNGTGTVSWAAAAATTAVDGPATSTVGNIASWNNGTGTLLADGGKPVSNLVTNAGAGTPGFVATFGASGTVIQNGSKLEVDLVTGPASASAVDNLASFNNINGKVIKDSGISSANLATMAAPASAANHMIISGGNSKQLLATPYTVPAAGGSIGQVLKMTALNVSDWADVPLGDVVSASSSTLNALVRFNSTSGKSIYTSPATLDDAGALAGITSINGKTAGDFVTMANPASVVNQVLLSAGTGVTGKSAVAAAYSFPTAGGSPGQVLKLTTATDAAWATVGGGDVSGPGPTTNANEIAVWVDSTGKLLRGVPLLYLNIVTMQATATTPNHVAIFDSTTGKSIADSGKLIGDLVTGPAAGALLGTLASFSDNGGKLIGGSTVIAADVVTKVTAPFTASNRVVLAGGNNKTLAETDYTFPPTSGGVGQILKMTAANQVTWVNVPSSFGDVTGPAATPTVSGSPATFADNTGRLLATVPYSLPITAGTNGYVLTTNGTNATSWTAASGGDVVGPAGSSSGTLAAFSGTGGKTLADSGVVAANVVTGPATASSTSIALFNGPTGKVIQTSVVSINAAGDLSGVGNIGSSGSLTVSGNLTVTGTGSFGSTLTAQSYTNTSDRKLKKDITPFSGGDLIDKLMPVTFRWKKGDDRPVIGLIAQDVEKVLPDVITITKTKDGSIRSYDVGQVLALTIEALKETRAEVKMLQEKIKKLEQKKR